MADEDGKAVAISTFLKGGILLSAPSSCTFSVVIMKLLVK